MLTQKGWRICLACFVACLIGAWVAKPGRIGLQLEKQGFHFERATTVDAQLKSKSGGGTYTISRKERERLIDYLIANNFMFVTDPAAKPGDLIWLNRTHSYIPNQPYQHVWITDGKDPQVFFSPDLK